LSAEGQDFLKAAVFGLLDVVLTAGYLPLRDFALRVVEVDSHPIDSSIMAFRKAGRDAGRKLLQEMGLGEWVALHEPIQLKPGANLPRPRKR
jgi:hypothetical protein